MEPTSVETLTEVIAPVGIVILAVLSVTQILKELVVKRFVPESVQKDVCVLIAIGTGYVAALLTGVDSVYGLVTGVLTTGTFGATSQIAKSVGTGLLEKKEGSK